MKAHFELHGAKVIWIVPGSTASSAQSYYAPLGATFGWYTGDTDNTWSPMAMGGTPMASGVPWLGIIDAKTMEVVYNNPYSVYGIVQTLGTD